MFINVVIGFMTGPQTNPNWFACLKTFQTPVKKSQDIFPIFTHLLAPKHTNHISLKVRYASGEVYFLLSSSSPHPNPQHSRNFLQVFHLSCSNLSAIRGENEGKTKAQIAQTNFFCISTFSLSLSLSLSLIIYI